MPEQPSTRKAELVDSELYSQYQNCDRWAIIVGISKYQHQSWNLRYADRDAEELYKLLLTPNGGEYKKENIRKLTNEQATSRNILIELHDFLKKPAREDLVLLYFACHGSPDPDRPNNLYLLTYDTEPSRIAGTALPMREIRLAIKETLLAEKVILLVDTCHSGGISEGVGHRSASDDSTRMKQYLQELSQSSAGLALLTSAETSQVARESEQWGGGHGVFTHYLLEGMQGAADDDNNGIVTVGELFEYVRDNVKRATGNQQHPVIGSLTNRKMPVAISDVTKFVAVKSEVPKPKLDGEIQGVLNSELGVSYARLRDLLEAGKWFEADRETSAVMLRATCREIEGWLDDKSLSNFPSTDLRTINQLWLKYSDEHFGFSIQQQIFENLSKKSLDAFGDAVGWKTQAGIFRGIFASWKNYSKLSFNLDTPRGHLPAWGQWAGKEVTEIKTVQSSAGGPESLPTYIYLPETRRIPLRDSYKIVFLRIQQSKLIAN